MKSKVNQIAAMLTMVAAFALTACGTLNPLSHAQTIEQKAYALYGEFVVVEEQAAVAVQDANVPKNVRSSIAAADAAAKPVADELLKSAAAVKGIRDELAAGHSTEEQLVIATASLQRWYNELSQQLPRLAAALKGARP
jgi:uncharacterized protein (UPF0147 family)